MKRLPTRAPLSREAIFRAALEILECEGLSALSMRQVGAALGVEAMSLYNHVPNKAALLDGIYERILETVASAPRGASWPEYALHQGRALREALAAHPAALPIFASRPAVTPAALGRLEQSLAALRAGGLDPSGALTVLQVVFSFVVGHTTSCLGPRRADEHGEVDYAALDPYAYPHVREASRELAGYDPEREFEIGLEALVDGLQRRVESSAPSKPSKRARKR